MTSVNEALRKSGVDPNSPYLSRDLLQARLNNRISSGEYTLLKKTLISRPDPRGTRRGVYVGEQIRKAEEAVQQEAAKPARPMLGKSLIKPIELKATMTPLNSSIPPPATVIDLRPDQSQPIPQVRTMELKKQSVVIDGQRVRYEDYARDIRAGDIVENLKLRQALPMTSYGAPIGSGRIMMTGQPREAPAPESKLMKAWRAINEPVDLSKVPVLGDTSRMANTLIAASLAGSMLQGQKMLSSDNAVNRALGRVNIATSEFTRDFYGAFEKDIRRPTTWLTAGFGSMLVRGGGAVARSVPILSSSITKNLLKGGLFAAYGASQAIPIFAGKKTLGTAFGEAAAYGTAYQFMDPAIGKAAETIKAGAAKFKSWQAERQMQKWLKSVTGDKWRITEGAAGPQRTLSGGSVSDPQLKAALRDLNKYKIGYGIEQNPLKPVRQSILPTGQTKLTRDEIWAFDNYGNFRAVRIMDNKPFIYDPAIKKYIEFDSSKYFLKTFKIGPTGEDPDRISKSFQALRNMFSISQSKQTTLTPAPSRLMKPFKAPAPDQIFKESLPKVISQGVKTTQISPAALTSFYKTQTTPVFMEPMTGAAGAALAQSNGRFTLFLPKLDISMKSGITQDLALSVLPRMQTKAKQRISADPLEKSLTATMSKIIPGTIIIPRQKTKTRTTPATIPKTSTTPITTPAPTPWPPIPNISKIFEPIAPPGAPMPPAPSISWFFTFDKRSRRREFPFKMPKQPRMFAPTLKSAVFRETGKTSIWSIMSGLGERKIRKKKKRGQLYGG